jgi:hypothetical protein
MVHTIVIAACVMSVATVTVAEDRLVGETYAVVVSGVGKDPQDLVARGQVLSDLRIYLSEKSFIPSERLRVLSPDVATAQEVKRAIETVALMTQEADRFVFYYVGQANVVGGSLRLNLSGPDPTQDDLARWLSAVKAKDQLVVLDCPCAAAAAKALARPGRIVVMAATETQVYSPRFSLHFVPTLTRQQSDTNHDGRVCVLEAFTAAAREIDQWYKQMKLLPTETPCIEDNGDGRPSERPWRHQQDGCDGRLAAEFVLAPGL